MVIAIHDEQQQEIATVNEQHEVMYTDRATAEQKAKIDALVDEIRRENQERQEPQKEVTQEASERQVQPTHTEAIKEAPVFTSTEMQRLTDGDRLLHSAPLEALGELRRRIYSRHTGKNFFKLHAVYPSDLLGHYGFHSDSDRVIRRVKEEQILFLRADSPAQLPDGDEMLHVYRHRVHIPPSWVKQQGLKIGDTVWLAGTEDGVLVLPQQWFLFKKSLKD